MKNNFDDGVYKICLRDGLVFTPTLGAVDACVEDCCSFISWANLLGEGVDVLGVALGAMDVDGVLD